MTDEELCHWIATQAIHGRQFPPGIGPVQVFLAISRLGYEQDRYTLINWNAIKAWATERENQKRSEGAGKSSLR